MCGYGVWWSTHVVAQNASFVFPVQVIQETDSVALIVVKLGIDTTRHLLWFVGLLVCWFVGLLVCWFVVGSQGGMKQYLYEHGIAGL